MTNLIVVAGVRGYNNDGMVMLNLEDVARGLGFTRTANSGNEVVMWSRVEGYLKEMSCTDVCTDRKGFIPENTFYKLAFKASNEIARVFQDKVCDEILPQIRKTGGYIPVKENETDAEIVLRAMGILQATIAQKDEIIAEQKRVKAHITAGREATLMGKLGVATKKIKKLESEIDKKEMYKSVKAMSVMYGQTYSFRPLKEMSAKLNYDIIKVEDVNYGEVNAYHVDMWERVYGIK